MKIVIQQHPGRKTQSKSEDCLSITLSRLVCMIAWEFGQANSLVERKGNLWFDLTDSDRIIGCPPQ